MSYPDIKAPKSIKKTPVDNTLRSPTEAGYVQARPRTTRPIYDFDVSLFLPEADKILLEAHDVSETGASIWSWYCNLDATTYQVRYTKRVSSARSPETPGWFDVTFSVQSV